MKAALHTKKRFLFVINHKATGKDFRACRVKANVSLRGFASAIGYSAAYVSDLELGKRAWTKHLLDCFNAKLAELQNH